MGVSLRRETRGGTLPAGGEATVEEEDARELEVTVAVEEVPWLRVADWRGRGSR